jgi:hypothetical protein
MVAGARRRSMEAARTNGIRRGRWVSLVLGGAVGLALMVAPGAAAKDRNHDQIPDRWENQHGLSLNKNQARKDQDSDKLNNKREFESGMDPNDPDSDDDGTEDGDEGSGTITAFDATTGSLTISVFGGGDVTGAVTEDTEVKCDNGDDNGDEDGDNEGGDEDHSGPGHDGNGGDDEGDDDDNVAARSDDGGESDDEENCSVDDLAVGAVVQEAELEVEDGSAVWEEIELLK